MARFTCISLMPASLRRCFSTFEEHAAHCIPSIGIVTVFSDIYETSLLMFWINHFSKNVVDWDGSETAAVIGMKAIISHNKYISTRYLNIFRIWLWETVIGIVRDARCFRHAGTQLDYFTRCGKDTLHQNLPLVLKDHHISIGWRGRFVCMNTHKIAVVISANPHFFRLSSRCLICSTSRFLPFPGKWIVLNTTSDRQEIQDGQNGLAS